jgi:hypothetical protein
MTDLGKIDTKLSICVHFRIDAVNKNSGSD